MHGWKRVIDTTMDADAKREAAAPEILLLLLILLSYFSKAAGIIHYLYCRFPYQHVVHKTHTTRVLLQLVIQMGVAKGMAFGIWPTKRNKSIVYLMYNLARLSCRRLCCVVSRKKYCMAATYRSPSIRPANDIL